MDAENDNDYEQPNSSSASSSNNSSSSNLLVNLPMLPILHSQDEDDNDNETDGLVHRRHSDMQQTARALPTHVNNQSQQQQQSQDSSIIMGHVNIVQFNAPLLFNNHTSPPHSSSSTSSSPSSSHIQHQNQQQLEHEHANQFPSPSIPTTLFSNSEHLHQQHSPPPFHQQQQQHHEPTPPTPPISSSSAIEHDQQPPQQQLQPPPTIEANSIAETIDASAILTQEQQPHPIISEIQDIDVDLIAVIASTSQQQQATAAIGANSNTIITTAAAEVATAATTSTSTSSVVAPSELTPPRPSEPTSLPLLLQADVKNTSTSTYCSHSFAHPHQHQLHQHYQQQYRLGFSSGGDTCSNIFNFDSKKNSSNGAATSMYSQSDNIGAQSSSGGNSGHGHQHQHHVVDRLKLLYPNVNENETPLPRCWSPTDKCLSIGLSQNNLRVHYKGVGKHNNDPASVRTAYPIPPACGLYYFEVKIISKGKNGYMGIGLTTQQFRMNRLPGWDKQSYGYHGDDGNSFSSSGNGQSYGPTFTTGDIIGCCVNFVNNTCFYTKNGIDLGIAFRDLPSKLFPTVGLQTPGEEVDANFGQEPFKFDQIEDMMKQMREEMKTTIYDFPMSSEKGDSTTLLHKMVSSYLVHNGYSSTAEAFARSTGQTFREDMPSIRNRQKIIKLAMTGKMGQAIEQTLRLYPGLLENNKNLWFMLKCRQFIEMINGSDIESTRLFRNGKTTANSTAVINSDNHQHQHQQELKNAPIIVDNCSRDEFSNSKSNDIESASVDYINDVEMENNGHSANGNSCKNGNSNNFNSSLDVDEEMDIDMSPLPRKYNVIERILEFGKELSSMGQQLEKDNKMTDDERQMLEDAFSLIAYSNPWSSPLGWQLCPSRRENVCTALNSAILESLSYPRRPPLDTCVAHASELLKVMAQASLGACAFINIEDVFPQN